MRTIVPLLICVLGLSGCSSKSKPPDKEKTVTAEFRIALRTEPYKRGDRIPSGDFVELNRHVFPVTLGRRATDLTSVADGVVLGVKWQEASLERGSSLILRGFSYRVYNELVSPHGTSWKFGWSEPRDIGLHEYWDHLLTPVGIDPSDLQSPQLVLQWRCSNSKDFEVEDFLLREKELQTQPVE